MPMPSSSNHGKNVAQNPKKIVPTRARKPQTSPRKTKAGKRKEVETTGSTPPSKTSKTVQKTMPPKVDTPMETESAVDKAGATGEPSKIKVKKTKRITAGTTKKKLDQNKLTQTKINFTPAEKVEAPPPAPPAQPQVVAYDHPESTPPWAKTMSDNFRADIQALREDINNSNARQYEINKNFETRVTTIEEGMQSMNTGINEVIERLDKLENQTCENGDLAALQEVRVRATDYVQLQKEVKIMAVDFEKIDKDKDYLTTNQLLQYFNDNTPGNEIDHSILNKVVEVKQLGRATENTTDNGKKLPKSAPFILSFNSNADRNTFWKTYSSKECPWRIQDSSMLAYKDIYDKMVKKRKVEQQKGRHARIRYFSDANVGFRYWVETRKDSSDRWRRTFEEIMPWENNYSSF